MQGLPQSSSEASVLGKGASVEMHRATLEQPLIKAALSGDLSLNASEILSRVADWMSTIDCPMFAHCARRSELHAIKQSSTDRIESLPSEL